MPKYKVLNVIEHNDKQYWPETDKASKTAPSFCHDGHVDVDASGVVELSDAEAKQLLVGRAVELVKEKAPEKGKKKEVSSD